MVPAFIMEDAKLNSIYTHIPTCEQSVGVTKLQRARSFSA